MGLRDFVTGAAAALAESPAARQAVASGAAALVDRLLRSMSRPKEDPSLRLYREQLDRLDEIIRRLPEPSPKPPDSSGPTGPTGVLAPPSPAGPVGAPGEGEGARKDVSAACVPCTRAHLLGVRGDLREALRFARESGVDHPEARRRIDHAAEEVVMLERYDLTPEAIAAAPAEEQAVIRELLPEIRRLRQKLVNEIDSVEDLEAAAVEAAALYERLQERTRRRPQEAQSIKASQEVLGPAPEEARGTSGDGAGECTPCKLAAAIGSARATLQHYGVPSDALDGVEDRCGIDAACIREAIERAEAQAAEHPEAHEALGVILEETFGRRV